MRARIIQLLNNYYNFMNLEESKPLGKYCVFGHFDALELSETFDTQASSNLWKTTSKYFVETLDLQCSRRTILCFEIDCDKVNYCRKDLDSYPILMVSFLRMKENYKKDISQYIIDNTLLYYTNAHSEIVALVYGNKYSECMGNVMSFENKPDILKMHTIFAVKEDCLSNGTVLDENVDCRMRLMVKDSDNDKIDNFFCHLDKELNVNGKRFNALGDCDILVEYSDVSLHRLLPLYKMGKMMTHPFYKDIFYNVETEIVKERNYNG